MVDNQDAVHFLDYWRVIRSRKEIVIFVFIFVFFTGLGVTYKMPKVYDARTEIAVRREQPDVAVFGKEYTDRYDPFFMATQFKIIQSSPVLERAVKNLNLESRFAEAYGLAGSRNSFRAVRDIIKGSLKVQQVPDTNLIEIRVALSKPKETANRDAAEIANEIANAFREHRMEESKREKDNALKAIYQELQAQQKKVREQEKVVEEIRKEHNITVVRVSAPGRANRIEKDTLRQMEANRQMISLELAEKESKLNKIKAMDQETLLHAVHHIVSDPALATLKRNLNESEIALVQFEESYGPKHPDVERTQAVIAQLNKKIDNALTGLKMGLEASCAATRAKLLDIEKQLDQAKAADISAEAERFLPFANAELQLQLERKIGEEMAVRYSQKKIELNIPRTIVEVKEKAEIRDRRSPVSPNWSLNVVLSIACGLIFGVGLAFFVEYLDTSVKTVEDIERYIGAPVLGVIPQKVKPLIDDSQENSNAEAYRVLRTNLMFSKRREEGKCFCFTSGSVGEGKSLTLSNLAIICAQLGDRVLAIDSDLHRPKLHKIFGLAKGVGLANVLMGEVSVEKAIVQTSVENLHFLSRGDLTATVYGLLDTARMRDLIDRVKEHYDFVFFDAPPVIGVSDASVLAREVDGVMLIIQYRKYPRIVSGRAKAMIENVGGNLVGVVLNNININREHYYHYYYGFKYDKH